MRDAMVLGNIEIGNICWEMKINVEKSVGGSLSRQEHRSAVAGCRVKSPQGQRFFPTDFPPLGGAAIRM